MQPFGTAENKARAMTRERYNSSRSKSVCTRAKLFKENRVNSSVNNQQKGRNKAPFLSLLIRSIRCKF